MMDNLINFQERQRELSTTRFHSRAPYRSDVVYGERIVQAREMHGMSQEELARRIGVSESDIAAFETGTVTPSHEQLAALCLALEFPVPFFCNPIPGGMFDISQTTLQLHSEVESEEEEEVYD